MRRELPFYYEGDERIFVQLAVRMAVSQDPNPHWFGNPGAALIYPLAFLYRLSDVLLRGAPLVGPDRPLLEAFRADPGGFYLAGRIMNVSYALVGLGLLFSIGRRAFSARAALAGVLLGLLCPLTMTHAQMVRTDAAGLCFAMLSLWASLRVLESPTPGRHVGAGAATGLALASRYFLAALLAPLCLAFWEGWRGRARSGAGRTALLPALLGLLAVPAVFAAVSPYFFLDFETARASLRGEARTTHRGADGLTPAGNVFFYAGEAIPGQLGPPAAMLAGLGVLRALLRRAAGPRLLALFVVAFLLGLCISPLHWSRWLIPILPLLALFAAATLDDAVSKAIAAPGREQYRRWAFGVGLGLLAAVPAARTGYEAIRAWRPTTRLLARDWLRERLPDGARIVAERGSAPLLLRQQALDERLDAEPHGLPQHAWFDGRSVDVLLVPSLPTGGLLEDYLREGYRYAVTTGVAPGAALGERGLSPEETRFYERLFGQARELAGFDPQPTRAGPAIRVWELPATGGAPPR